jgi:uncharacterized delta-60 repeat protein
MLRLLPVLAVLPALLAPAAASARAGDPDTSFGHRGTVTLKATGADAVGGAVKALSDGKVLAGGSAAGKLVVLRLRSTGTLDSRFGTAGQVVPSLPGLSPDGVRALATLRDGRVVAAATLDVTGGLSRFVVLRTLPNGEIDPSFGAGLGYTLAGPGGATLAAMAVDRAGNIYLAGARPTGVGEIPVVMRLLPDGTPDPAFAAGGTLDGATLGLSGRATSLLVRPDGTTAFSVGAAPGLLGPSTFTVVRLLPTGAPDPTFAGTGIVSLPLAPGSGPGVGAAALRGGPGGRIIVAGSDVTTGGALRVAVVRLLAGGQLDSHFGAKGVARVSRGGENLRVSAMVRDPHGRIVLVGTGRPPGALVVRLTARGARDTTFGNGGITYPALGRPPGGDPIFTTLDSVDAFGSKLFLAGSAAGPAPLVRGPGGTSYQGRFAITISRLH